MRFASYLSPALFFSYKTYTMFGPGGIGDGINTETGEGSEECGVIPRAFVELFRLAKVCCLCLSTCLRRS